MVVVRFRRPYAHMFGPPNDEAFEGHPLAARGLASYAVYEVRRSSWLRRLERMNAVHWNHRPERFLARLRHFVFAFHDATFECIAEGFTFEGSCVDRSGEMTSQLCPLLLVRKMTWQP